MDAKDPDMLGCIFVGICLLLTVFILGMWAGGAFQ